MKSRYSVPITRKDAHAYLRAYFGNVQMPAGAHYLWLAGIQYVTEQPGVYLRAVCGGLEGVQIIPAAVEQVEEKTA